MIRILAAIAMVLIFVVASPASRAANMSVPTADVGVDYCAEAAAKAPPALLYAKCGKKALHGLPSTCDTHLLGSALMAFTFLTDIGPPETLRETARNLQGETRRYRPPRSARISG